MNYYQHQAFVGHMLRENAAEQQRRKDATRTNNLFENVREGIRRGWMACPNLYPNNFDLDRAAWAAVNSILGYL